MKQHFWYVAKMQWRESNSPYHAIVRCYWDGEDPIIYVVEHDGMPKVRISELHSFEIVREIEEMNAWSSKMKKARS